LKNSGISDVNLLCLEVLCALRETSASSTLKMLDVNEQQFLKPQ
jgi:hypothetical protein